MEEAGEGGGGGEVVEAAGEVEVGVVGAEVGGGGSAGETMETTEITDRDGQSDQSSDCFCFTLTDCLLNDAAAASSLS